MLHGLSLREGFVGRPFRIRPTSSLNDGLVLAGIGRAGREGVVLDGSHKVGGKDGFEAIAPAAGMPAG